jgi:hypothetical protein
MWQVGQAHNQQAAAGGIGMCMTVSIWILLSLQQFHLSQ